LDFAVKHEHTRILMVPSTRDVFHPFQVFPQSPFKTSDYFATLRTKENTAAIQRINMLPNPCIFAVNEVHIGISTLDILFHLGSDEIFRQDPTQAKGDRMSRLTKHIMDQRSFYPLNPPNIHEPVVDYCHSREFAMPILPDILILPSKLGVFAKVRISCTIFVDVVSVVGGRCRYH